MKTQTGSLGLGEDGAARTEALFVEERDQEGISDELVPRREMSKEENDCNEIKTFHAIKAPVVPIDLSEPGSHP